MDVPRLKRRVKFNGSTLIELDLPGIRGDIMKEFGKIYKSYGTKFRGHKMERHNEFTLESSPAVRLARDLLLEYGFPIQNPGKEVFVEIHRYMTDANREPIMSQLALHQDNGGHFARSTTIVFYVRKDEGVMGGDLVVRCPEEKIIVVTPPENGVKIMMFDGDIWHRPGLVRGDGARDCIVMFFENEKLKVEFDA